jgi:AbrB family looped-hinge helix DNA binding protein
MGASTVTTKGQITIPAKIRDEFGIESGDEIVFMKGLDGRLKVHVAKRRSGAGRGILKSSVKLTQQNIDRGIAEAVAERRGSDKLRSSRRSK